MGGNMVIDYLYRDGSNYKRFGRRVLANPAGVAPDRLWAAFRQAFRASQLFPDVVHFDPAALGWEMLFFPDHDTDADDIGLHELLGIEGTLESVDAAGSVYELLLRLQRLSKA
jgi:hypothetical protein